MLSNVVSQSQVLCVILKHSESHLLKLDEKHSFSMLLLMNGCSGILNGCICSNSNAFLNDKYLTLQLCVHICFFSAYSFPFELIHEKI